MPQYKVIAKGFYNGMLYDPEGKRTVLNTDKPFTKKNKMPKWLSEMPKESPELKKKREAYEKSKAELDEAKDEQDKKDIDAASSQGAGEAQSFLSKVGDVLTGNSDKPADSGSTVETI